MNAITVYTTIFDGRDLLREPLVVEPHVAYRCFTDDHRLRSKVWDISLVSFPGIDPVRAARWYKTMPHRVLDECGVSIWVDGQVQLTGNMRELVSSILDTSGVAAYQHPERDCVYEEGHRCIELYLDRRHVIEEQLERYQRQGFPPHGGLFELKVLVRRHKAQVFRMNERWWEEIATGSHRDQISFPFALKQSKLEYLSLGPDIRTSAYFQVSPHPYIPHRSYRVRYAVHRLKASILRRIRRAHGVG